MAKLLVIICSFFSMVNFASTWKFVSEKNGIKLYNGVTKSSILPFKAEAVIDAPIEDIYNTLMDWRRKHEWSPKLKNVRLHEKVNEENFIFSEFYSTPWPATDREFLLNGRILKHKNGNFSLSAKSVTSINLISKYKSEDHVQADVNRLVFKAFKLSPVRTKISFVFMGDIKGWIPNWLSNIIQKKWPLRFIEAMRYRLASGFEKNT